jgi:hypothetical protein
MEWYNVQTYVCTLTVLLFINNEGAELKNQQIYDWFKLTVDNHGSIIPLTLKMSWLYKQTRKRQHNYNLLYITYEQ